MQIANLEVGYVKENCYLYWDEQTLEGIIIDPGDEGSKLIKFIDKRKIKLKAILITHAHYDHIGACLEIKARYNIPISIGKKEVPLLSNNNLNGLVKVANNNNIIEADRTFVDNDIFEFGNCKLKVIFTPGHTAGGVCFYDEANQILFSGDTLFLEGIGRSDYPTGNSEQIMSSIKNKLFKLPNEVRVFPGHGLDTTIIHEKQNNPFI